MLLLNFRKQILQGLVIRGAFIPRCGFSNLGFWPPPSEPDLSTFLRPTKACAWPLQARSCLQSGILTPTEAAGF